MGDIKIRHTIVLPPEDSDFLRLTAAASRRDMSEIVSLALKVLKTAIEYPVDDLFYHLPEAIRKDVLALKRQKVEVVA